jgi:formate-dependent nitrite reductase membrane component NrfD
MVPEAEFTSYYGKPVLKEPTWQALDIAGYLFLGGLAGGSSLIAAGADLTRRPSLAAASRVAAAGAIGVSLAALVHDLGRPSRFVNMLRVFKVTSPMSVGSWLLAGYGPLAFATAASELTGRWRPLGRLTGIGAAGLGSGVMTYTAALVADTANPAWHEAKDHLPVLFAASGTSAAAGLGLLAAPLGETAPARRAAVAGAAIELAASRRMRHGIGLAGEAYETGRAATLTKAAEALTAAGGVLAAVSRRSRWLSGVAGGCLLAGSAATRFAVFEAGVVAARDPKFVVIPQRARRNARENP